MENILVKNGLIVTAEESFRSDLLILNGVVADIGEDLERPGARRLDATDRYVMPGGVDAHTHLNLTVGNHTVCDGFYEGSAAAAFGGTTCVVEHPGFGPDGCSLTHQIAAYRRQADAACVVDFALHGVFQHVTRSILEEIPALLSMGVSSAKIYLTYDGRLADHEILQVLDHGRRAGLLTAFHAENHAIIDFLTKKDRLSGRAAPRFHPLSRPAYGEAEAVHRVVALSEAAGEAPVYVVHLSTEAGLEIVEAARARGLPVHAEVCPQHLLLDDSCYCRPGHEGLKFIMAPPARKPADAAALWRGLARKSIDVVATDHCSFSFADKLAAGEKDYSRCPGGVPGVETRLPLLFSEGVCRNRISLNRFVDLVSTSPAKLMGLYPRKGHLSPGADGDVVIFDPGAEKTIQTKNLRQNADYSPFEGWRVRGWPETTIVRGRIVHHKGRLRTQPGWGRYIERDGAVRETPATRGGVP